MITTKLPIIDKQIDEKNNKILTSERDIDVTIDTSLFAEERWEANFPLNAQKETLFAYIERVKNAELIESKAHILSNLKAVYCFMEGEDIADFKSFCQLFDLADEKYISKLIDKIKYVFDIVLKSSAANPKN